MSAPVKSTPVKATPVRERLEITDSPGTWRHPRIHEITRRRNATTFSETNIRRIAYNTAAFLGLLFLRLFITMQIDPQIVPATFRLYLSWAWFVAQTIPLVQIGLACMPLLRATDDLADIPLTQDQRRLLGLAPSSAKPTPDAKFSTPPRYSRTPSISGSPMSRGSVSRSSPLSGRGSPVLPGTPTPVGGSGSPLGSPLLHRSTSGLGNGRRLSFGAGGSFGASTSTNLLPDSGAPGSPSAGKRTSVGLNSKWLYERGRRSSGSAWVH